MVENTSGYSLGNLRYKYLDYGHTMFAQNNYIAADNYVKNFLNTIKEDSDVAKKIKEEFDKITSLKRKHLEELQKSIESVGFLEQKDISDEGHRNIEINYIHDKLNVCYLIALDNGLFYDK